MNLATASRYADQLLAWLTPYSQRLAIAGSIRRQRPECADIDILCIPKHSSDTDLFGYAQANTNSVFDHLQDYIRDRNPTHSPARTPRFISGGDKLGKQILLELPKCQLDLWFADDRTWSTRLLCRTGSKEHNIWLAQRAIDRGLHWNPYEGLTPSDPSDSSYLPSTDEAALYAHLGLAFIEPQNRELPWLKKHIDSGLS